MKTMELLNGEVKAYGDTGSFDGYASIFGNIDQGGDIIERGAFKEMVKTRDGQVLVLYQHSTRDPIGKATVEQDSKGLRFKGTLEMNDPTARKAYNLMKGGILDGMSIGYDVLPGGAHDSGDGSGNRILSALKLYEISPVTFGMNELARIEGVKRSLQITTIREFEDFLRDAGGYSAAQAKLLASRGWAGLDTRRDGGDGAGGDMKQLCALLDSIGKPTQ